MNFFKPKFWDKNQISIFSVFLFPISLLIKLVNLIRQYLVKTKKTPIPTICVGNIYLGGTGKTPLCIEIFSILKDLNLNPAFIRKKYDSFQDEADLLKQSGTIYQNKKRMRAIEEAAQNNADIAILDDGFQDLSIYKNFNIVCFNQKQWTGNNFLIPAGPLRENLSALNRADCILINGKKDTKIENEIYRVNKNAKVFYSKYEPLDIDSFKGKKICAFAGIGNPSNFFELLKENNLNLVKTFSYPDHHEYSYTEIENMVKKYNDCILLTTEKDYCRIPLDSVKVGFKIEYLKIRLDIENKDNFIKLIKDKI